MQDRQPTDMTNLEIFCNCSGVPARMMFVKLVRGSSFLNPFGYKWDHYIYKCTMCGLMKHAYWFPGTIIRRPELKVDVWE